MNVIKVENLCKTFKAKIKEPGLRGSWKALFHPNYKEIKAVDNISFNIEAGELIGFIGPNGAGKSTTIKMMSGILFPTSGSINVLGFDPQQQRKKLAYHMGTVFGQRQQLSFHLPARDSFELLASIYNIDQKKYKKRLAHLVKTFQAEQLIDTPVRKLSLGERMRCEIIASLLHEPKVLFLDEPTIGLDIIAKKQMREFIAEINRREGVTVILTSHDMDDIEKICERAIIINKGTIMFDGPMEDIRKRYLKYKVVEAIFNEPTKLKPVKGVRFIQRSPLKTKLELDTVKTSVAQLLVHLKKASLADLTITDPPIEEIIAWMYQK